MEETGATSFEKHVTDSLARLETNMYSLIGNGQPGRITKLEEDVKRIIWVGLVFMAVTIGPPLLMWVLK